VLNLDTGVVLTLLIDGQRNLCVVVNARGGVLALLYRVLRTAKHPAYGFPIEYLLLLAIGAGSYRILSLGATAGQRGGS
jgi:hypothetical protein